MVPHGKLHHRAAGRIEPAHDLVQIAARKRDAACGRGAVADVQEVGRTRARDHGGAVVVDDYGVVVGGTGRTQVLSGGFVERAAAGAQVKWVL